MKILITGDRNWTSVLKIRKRLRQLPVNDNMLIIHGGAPGADMVADNVAKSLGLHTARVDALWDSHGRGAGPRRNLVMLKLLQPDLVIGFHSDLEHSRGTKHCLVEAAKRNIPTELWK